MKVSSLVLIGLLALSLVSGCIAITVCYADNPKPYSPSPIEPTDNPKPYDPPSQIEPTDNPKPYGP